jgi:SNF2 family DNA or RNA helicase
MELKEIISNQIQFFGQNIEDKNQIVEAELMFNQGACQILTQSAESFELLVEGKLNETEVKLTIEDDRFYPLVDGKICEWDKYSIASIFQLDYEIKQLNPNQNITHKKYSREGMIKRVLDERRSKAKNADYKIKWGKSIYGDHVLTNENGKRYKIFLRDFEKETGYSDSADSRTNKLGTTKHIMYAFDQLKSNKSLYNRLSKEYPYVEVYLDPLNDYQVTWNYPHALSLDIQLLMSKYFNSEKVVEDGDLFKLIDFINESKEYDSINIRPEVHEKIDLAYEQQLLTKIEEQTELDYSKIDATLFDYQKQGVEFAVYKKGVIIADEMGLGKTIQAIATAVLKKQIFGFNKTLIVCPASLKSQWKKEIEKFTDEKAVIVEGFPEERVEIYENSDAFFYILNYETVLRDKLYINKSEFDLLILDEAQKVKNYVTKTSNAIKSISKKHTLIITGTPIENKLIDLFSIMGIIDPYFLGPLWEFSYQHCQFDPSKPNKINSYFNLQSLNEKLKPVLLRRQKSEVMNQLPQLQQMDVPVGISEEQAEIHALSARSIASIIRKKFLTPFDMQRMQQHLTTMRMVCNSTYLIDEETNISPKLDELEHTLIEKLDIKNKDSKVIIFSEWVKSHKIIGQLLRKHNIGFAELNGKVAVKHRGELIRKFEENPDCKVFLSTEAGGAGLNLQVADTLINFELPWNPAKKNQRIGRIDRIGQKSNSLTVINFITRDSIEMKIASGLIVKQNLFEGVLNDSSSLDEVDFSEKGRSQFLKQLEEMIGEFETPTEQDEIVQEVVEHVIDKVTDATIEQESVDDSVDNIEDEDEFIETNLKSEEKLESNEPENNESVTQEQESAIETAEQMEQVMNQGLGFLSGLMKMSTGKDVGLENQKIEVDKKTGEVSIKFKLPGF